MTINYQTTFFDKASFFKTAVIAVEGTAFPKGAIVAVKFTGEWNGKKLFATTFGNKTLPYFEAELEGFVL